MRCDHSEDHEAPLPLWEAAQEWMSVEGGNDEEEIEESAPRRRENSQCFYLFYRS
jgi:hypothetical protein